MIGCDLTNIPVDTQVKMYKSVMCIESMVSTGDCVEFFVDNEVRCC